MHTSVGEGAPPDMLDRPQTEPAAVELEPHRPRPPAPGLAGTASVGVGARRRPPAPLLAGAVAVVVAGVLLRFWTRSDLWLDEALTVNISSLPLSDIPGALRRDGAPPLYYVLLHGWMKAFGDSDLAVRSLSGVFSLAALPAAFAAARRLAGPRAGWTTLLVLAANPFAIRYANETRMYALVMLEVTVGLLAVLRARERPGPARLGAVALVSAALLYTHYWAVYLLTAAVLLLAWRSRTRGWRTAPDSRVLVAVVAGGVLWLPWLPTFLFQAAHTGTPWATPAAPAAFVSVFSEFSGGSADGPRLLMILLLGLCALGLFGRAIDGNRLELDLRGRAATRPLAVVLLVAPALALAAGVVSQTAFVSRYNSVVLPFFVVLAGAGAAVFTAPRRLAVVLGAVTLLGLGLAVQSSSRNRTQAGEMAGHIAAAARPGDLVAYCPDQLGPSTSRLLGNRFDQVSFPRGDGPHLIDWVDYAEANKAVSPASFALALERRAGPSADIWLVTWSGYRTAAKVCTELEARLLALRPGGRQVVRPRPGRYFEPAALIRYPAPARVP